MTHISTKLEMEPFFNDILVSPENSEREWVESDPIWRIMKRSGVDEKKLLTIYTDTRLQKIIYHKMHKRDVTANSVIFAANSQIKVGFDRRNNVDIFFVGVRTLLMVDFDDNNKWKLTRDDFIRLLESLSQEGYTFALHETDRGLHAFCISHEISISNSEIYRIMRCAATDPFYLLFTLSQGVRVRVSPKAANLTDWVARPITEMKGVGAYDPSVETWVIGKAPAISRHVSSVKIIINLVEYFRELYKSLGVTREWFNGVVANKELLNSITKHVHSLYDRYGISISSPTQYPSGSLLSNDDLRPSVTSVESIFAKLMSQKV